MSQLCTAAHKLCPHVLRAASAAAQLFTPSPQQLLQEMGDTAEPAATQPQRLLFTLACLQPTFCIFTLLGFSMASICLQHICNDNRRLTLTS